MLLQILGTTRRLALAGTLALGVAAAGTLGAAPADQTEVSTRPRVEVLLDELAAAPSTREAQRLERQILLDWSRSDSDTVDLLMEWAAAAMKARENERALRYLDRVVRLAPHYPEGWNRRATVHYLLDNYGQSLADIGHVLALQPRHFGALNGLGLVLDELDRDDEALSAFQEAMQVHPFLEGAEVKIRKLTRQVEGQPI